MNYVDIPLYMDELARYEGAQIDRDTPKAWAHYMNNLVAGAGGMPMARVYALGSLNSLMLRTIDELQGTPTILTIDRHDDCMRAVMPERVIAAMRDDRNQAGYLGGETGLRTRLPATHKTAISVRVIDEFEVISEQEVLDHPRTLYVVNCPVVCRVVEQKWVEWDKTYRVSRTLENAAKYIAHIFSSTGGGIDGRHAQTMALFHRVYPNLLRTPSAPLVEGEDLLSVLVQAVSESIRVSPSDLRANVNQYIQTGDPIEGINELMANVPPVAEVDKITKAVCSAPNAELLNDAPEGTDARLLRLYTIESTPAPTVPHNAAQVQDQTERDDDDDDDNDDDDERDEEEKEKEEGQQQVVAELQGQARQEPVQDGQVQLPSPEQVLRIQEIAVSTFSLSVPEPVVDEQNKKVTMYMRMANVAPIYSTYGIHVPGASTFKRDNISATFMDKEQGVSNLSELIEQQLLQIQKALATGAFDTVVIRSAYGHLTLDDEGNYDEDPASQYRNAFNVLSSITPNIYAMTRSFNDEWIAARTETASAIVTNYDAFVKSYGFERQPVTTSVLVSFVNASTERLLRYNQLDAALARAPPAQEAQQPQSPTREGRGETVVPSAPPSDMEIEAEEQMSTQPSAPVSTTVSFRSRPSAMSVARDTAPRRLKIKKPITVYAKNMTTWINEFSPGAATVQQLMSELREAEKQYPTESRENVFRKLFVKYFPLAAGSFIEIPFKVDAVRK